MAPVIFFALNILLKFAVITCTLQTLLLIQFISINQTRFYSKKMYTFILLGRIVEKGGIELVSIQTVENGIAMFQINRPEKMNAINFAVMNELEAFLNTIEANEQINYVVITGSGDRAFCAGGDLAAFHQIQTAKEAYPMLSRMARLLYRLASLPVPVIALVNGTAVGGGCEIASACDFRIISSKAKAGFIQGTLAITTGWGGATQLFEKMQRPDKVMQLLSEAKIHTADELLQIGWASAVYEGDSKKGLAKFLEHMMTIHPNVHKTYKKLAIANWERADVENRMLHEAQECAQLWESDAHHEAVNRFINK